MVYTSQHITPKPCNNHSPGVYLVKPGVPWLFYNHLVFVSQEQDDEGDDDDDEGDFDPKVSMNSWLLFWFDYFVMFSSGDFF